MKDGRKRKPLPHFDGQVIDVRNIMQLPNRKEMATNCHSCDKCVLYFDEQLAISISNDRLQSNKY